MAIDDRSEPRDTEPLLTISGFARTVGLSASALRTYADSGLVVPAEVDAHTGYRYYTPEQQRRAIMVRRLRDADVPLADIAIVLGGDRERARAVLTERLAHSADRAAAARAILADVLAVLSRPEPYDPDPDGLAPASESASSEPTVATVSGPALASAVGQIRHASGRSGDDTGLDGVLLDLEPPALTVVATDRYWLARRDLGVVSASGPHRRLLLGLDAAADVAACALRHAEVRVVADGKGGRIEDHDSTDSTVLAEIAPATHRFPAWRQVLDQLPEPTSRLVLERAAVVDLLARTRHAVVDLAVDPATDGGGSLGDDDLRVAGIGSGTPTVIEVSAPLLTRALAAAVGTYVVVDAATSRSALRLTLPDQPGFTALVMPMRADG